LESKLIEELKFLKSRLILALTMKIELSNIFIPIVYLEANNRKTEWE